MKRKVKNKINKLVILFLMTALLIPMAFPVYAENGEVRENSHVKEQNDIIYIDTAKDFLTFAKNCSLDTWSQGKQVVLRTDISLKDTGFLSVPTFGGTFDGGGHTISGLEVTDTVMPAGIFGILQETAVVKNLNVSGDFAPSGDADIVGGIAGENHGTLENCSFTGSVSGNQNIGGIAGINGETGKIRNCSISGVISGDSATGGIAGYNLGEISSCQNNAYINIASVDPSLSPDDIDIDYLTDISKRYSLDTNMSSADTGGIAGYSTGLLLNCVNNGTVGYQHIGYNVGGIAGRNSGYMEGCVNNADVYGRKDVGGITGQMEPYIANNLTEDTLSKLQEQMDSLNAMVNKTLDDANAGSSAITNRLNRMADYLDSAAGAAKNIQTNGSVNTTVNGSGQESGSASGSVTPPGVEADSSSSGEISGSAGTSGIPPESEMEGSSSGGNSVNVEFSSGTAEGEQSSSAQGTVSGTTQITVNTSLHKLSAAISGMAGQMRLLNGEVSGTSGILTDDLKEINQQVNAISDTFFNAILSTGDDTEGDILTDTSEVDIDAVTYGKVISGKNSGCVNGDINVGGIAGIMAMDYEMDPEDDLPSNLSSKRQQEFELKAILQNCVNTGQVISKRNYVGSVCGHMELGLITECEGYGDAKSENGDYVGGIAGLAGGSIRKSYSKCTLKGKDYVGGIAGSGVKEDITGSSSSITGCYAMVDIAEYEQYGGGIAGSDAGEFSGNYFVSENIEAINRMNYSGKAEPISYEELLKVEGLPEDFKHLTLRFIADGETLKKISFDYGDSLDEEVYPSLPQKDGYYAQWDKRKLENLHFDTVVTAEYVSYASTLADEQVREDGRPIFLIEGLFEDGETATITAQAHTPAAVGVIPESLEDGVKEYFSFLKNRKLPKKKISSEIVEQWRIQIPDDGLSQHRVRYLSPDGKANNLDIYIKEDGDWNKAETEVIGSYLTFEITEDDAEIAVIEKIPVWWIWIIFLAIILLVLLKILKRVSKIRKQREKSDENKPKKKRQAEKGKKDSDQVRKKSDEKSVKKKKKKKKKNMKKKKKKKRFFKIILILICCAAAGAALYFLPGIQNKIEAYQLLRDYDRKEELSMELNVQADIGSEQADITAKIYRTEKEGHRITRIDQSGISLYYCDETIYLENGKAFQVSSLFPDYSSLLGKTSELYQSITITESEDEDGNIYSIIAEGENAKNVIAVLVPSVADQLSDAQVIRINLKEKDRQLTEISFQADGTLNNDAKTKVSVEAVLLISEEANNTITVPGQVFSSIETGNTKDTAELTEHYFRLLSAWEEALNRDVLSAKMDLAADCGPLVINDSMQMFRTSADGQKINCIQKNGQSVYFTEEAICDQEGNTIMQEEDNLADSAMLLKIAYQACMEGDFSCSESDGGYIYTMTLDEEGMETVAYAIAPEAKSMNISLGTGSIQITVLDDSLRNIHFTCNGSVKVVATDVTVSLSGNLLIDDEDAVLDYSVPDAVIRALK